jgi:hypothetical protein
MKIKGNSQISGIGSDDTEVATRICGDPEVREPDWPENDKFSSMTA